MTARKPIKKCDCITQVNTQLATAGVKIMQHMQLNFSTGVAEMSGPVIEVYRVDSKKRGRMPVVLCSYCPFCGKRQAK